MHASSFQIHVPKLQDMHDMPVRRVLWCLGTAGKLSSAVLRLKEVVGQCH